MTAEFIVITGGPCSGKTTIIQALARTGYTTVPEAATELIEDPALENLIFLSDSMGLFSPPNFTDEPGGHHRVGRGHVVDEGLALREGGVRLGGRGALRGVALLFLQLDEVRALPLDLRVDLFRLDADAAVAFLASRR